MVVDGTGMGAGVLDRLVEMGVDAVGFFGGEKALETRRFGNRCGDGVGVPQGADRRALDIDPEDEALASDLGMIIYGYDSPGRIVLESKDQLRSRGESSPDYADAAIMAAVGDLMPDLGAFLDSLRKPKANLTSDLLKRAFSWPMLRGVDFYEEVFAACQREVADDEIVRTWTIIIESTEPDNLAERLTHRSGSAAGRHAEPGPVDPAGG